MTWNRVAVAGITMAALGTTGCKTGMTGTNLFAWGKKPAAETLAGSGPSATYPAPPSTGHTPAAIASTATGSTASPTNTPSADTQQVAGNSSANPYGGAGNSPYGAPSGAAQANGYNSAAASPYGAVTPTNPYAGASQPQSPYGMAASSNANQEDRSAYNTASAANDPAYAGSQPSSPYGSASGAGGYTAPSTGTPSPYSSAGNSVAPATGDYRPGSTGTATEYPGMNSSVAPSNYSTPATQTPGSTYSMPTATSPNDGGSIYR